jgi:hypothetical protein
MIAIAATTMEDAWGSVAKSGEQTAAQATAFALPASPTSQAWQPPGPAAAISVAMDILTAMSLAWATDRLSPVVTTTASRTVNTFRTGQSVMAHKTTTANLSKTRRSVAIPSTRSFSAQC